jgi:hypothetical protein
MITIENLLSKIDWTNVITHTFAFLLAYVGAHIGFHLPGTTVLDWNCLQAGLIAMGGTQAGYRLPTNGNSNGNNHSESK